MSKRSVMKLYLTAFAALIVTPLPGGGQSLLAIPDLNPVGVLAARRDSATIQDFFVTLMPAISSDRSEIFWAEKRKSLLPGSSLGLGTGRGAVHTELAEVLSGAWRFSAATTLSVAARDSAAPADAGTKEMTTGFGRFVAGGGNLSLQGIRPLVHANFGEHGGGALLFIPRAWLNVPELSSAEGISDYGAEAAASILLQRRDNDRNPFLSLELRGGIVVGSSEFYETIGRTEHERFVYLAPSLTFTLQDQVNIGVSTFISGAFKNQKTMTLRFTLLNKNGNPEARQTQRQGVAAGSFKTVQ